MRAESSSHSRIGVLSAVFVAGLAVVLVHLWFLMVHNHQVWAQRSYENRWAFRSVPSRRGSLLDRNGQVLARDVPTMQVTLYYQQFRRYNVVGAAVHGAHAWSHANAGTEVGGYGFVGGQRGPRQACRDLLHMPVGALRPGLLAKELGDDLRRYATVLLAGCSGRPRRQVYTTLRETWEAGVAVELGDVLADCTRGELLDVFDERVALLEELHDDLWRHQLAWAEREGRDVGSLETLFDLLERMRQNSGVQQRSMRRKDGDIVPGALMEEIRRVAAPDVPFDVSARLRVDRDVYVGLDCEPSVRRERLIERGSSFEAILGTVSPMELLQQAVPAAPADGEAAENGADAAGTGAGEEARDAEPKPSWLDRYLQRELGDEWGDQLVPEGLAGDERVQRHMVEQARRRYRYEMLRRERRGRGGLERANDDELIGQLGMRFVEHDSRRREQLLYKHLNVEPGRSVRVTFDMGVQQIVERVVRDKAAYYIAAQQDPDTKRLVQAAFALIDAHTGDVLAFAGAPTTEEQRTWTVPGLTWKGNGSLGSVVKPFVTVEQLDAERSGRPHMSRREMVPCTGAITMDTRYGSQVLTCTHPHGQAGRDPEYAIKQSCNIFFFQAAQGFGEVGVMRALRRFGLVQGSAGEDFAACWQDGVQGMRVSAGGLDRSRRIPMRAIGYGVQVSPLYVARAYAALATGRLPTLGTRLGEDRPQIALVGYEEAFRVVREGLRECVQSGTANRSGLELLQEVGVYGKTGTAEVGAAGKVDNNGWFAGYLPWTSASGVQLAFCGVVYRVPDGEHGAEVGGAMLVDVLRQMDGIPDLKRRYLTPAGG